MLEGRSTAGTLSTSSDTHRTSTVVVDAWTTYPPNEAGDSLYSVLGVPRNATREEIDAAFLRFRYRDVSNFGSVRPINMDRVEYAYSILSHPFKRALYNKFGEENLRMIENRYSMAAADHLGLHIAALVSTTVTVVLMLLVVIQVLVVGLKLDGQVSSAWPVALIPLWIVWATLTMAMIGFGYCREVNEHEPPAIKPPEIKELSQMATTEMPAQADAKEGFFSSAGATRRFEGSYTVLIVVGYAVGSALACAALENDLPYWAAPIAFAASEFIYVVRAIAIQHPSAMQREFARRGASEIPPVWLWLLMVSFFLRGALWLFTWILFALRLSRVITCSYALIFLPSFVSLLINVLAAGVFSKVLEEGRVDDGKLPVVKHMVWHSGACTCILLSTVLFALRFDGTIDIPCLACIAPLLLFTSVMLCFTVYAFWKAATLTVDAPPPEADDDEFAAVAHRFKAPSMKHPSAVVV